MSIRRRTFFGIALLLVGLLGIALWRLGPARVQTRLLLASSHVSNTTNSLRLSLAPDFRLTQTETQKTGCSEESPQISFTRLYDCNATAQIELTSVQPIANTRAEQLIRAALERQRITPDELADMDSFVQRMDDPGYWQTALPLNIPHTAIAGVPPFNYYGGIGQEDIGLKIEAKTTQSNPKNIVLTVTAIQEYHSCKSFFLPCEL